MNRFERLEAAIQGKPVDRIPISAWGHFYDKETTAEGMAEIMLSFREEYDWDYLKIHARASYHVEGWGFSYTPSGDRSKLHTCNSHPISKAEDWLKLKPISLEDDALQEQFKVIELIRKEVGGKVPIIMTVFTPLDIADKLVDRNEKLLLDHLQQNPDAVCHALNVFTESFVPFVRKLALSGIDGIYFSSKWLSRLKLSPQQYKAIAAPYDLELINEAKDLWCNFFHLCQDDVDLTAVKELPIQVVHWDANTPANPDYGAGKQLVDKAVGGGVDSHTLANGTPEDVRQKVIEAINNTKGRKLVLGPGCSIVTAKTPKENLTAMKQAAWEVNYQDHQPRALHGDSISPTMSC